MSGILSLLQTNWIYFYFSASSKRSDSTLIKQCLPIFYLSFSFVVQFRISHATNQILSNQQNKLPFISSIQYLLYLLLFVYLFDVLRSESELSITLLLVLILQSNASISIGKRKKNNIFTSKIFANKVANSFLSSGCIILQSNET